MHTTTPAVITPEIRRLCQRLGTVAEPIFVAVHPEGTAKIGHCFPNVHAHTSLRGGEQVFGWQIWEWRDVLVEAEFHSIWNSPSGEMVDITPKADGERRILFTVDEERRYSGRSVNNVREAIRGDVSVRHYIELMDAVSCLMNPGEGLPGQALRIDRSKLKAPVQAAQLVQQLLDQGLRDHDPCPCRSRLSYAECHALRVEILLQQMREVT